MVKRKSKGTIKKNDNMPAFIVLAFFVGVIALFFVFSRHKAPAIQEKIVPAESIVPESPVTETPAPLEVPIHVRRVKPIEHKPYEPVEQEPVEPNLYPGGKIAFIIDDWGQSTSNCKYLREIPEPIAVSILPGLRHTKDVAACAGLYHKLAMLHLPLEAQHNYDFYPPNYIIKTTMPPALASKIVDEDLAQLPSIEGVNNHMGSKATENRPLMRLIFKKIKKKGLFFVDSMTARNTVCAVLADEMGLAFGKRDVFLDNVNTREAITRQIIILAQKAHRRGYAVAIGHDRHLTMQVIKDRIPWLEAQGFQIVSIKELLKNK